MARRRIELRSKAEKGLRKIPKQYAARIGQVIDALSENPWPSGCSKMVGGVATFRVRVGVYRIIYQVSNECVLIELVGHRKEVYR